MTMVSHTGELLWALCHCEFAPSTAARSEVKVKLWSPASEAEEKAPADTGAQS
jgi:hypothetical protein